MLRIGALLAVVFISITAASLAQQSEKPLDTAKFDKCMKANVPNIGPNLAFLAGQAACHVYIRSTSPQQETGSLCVAQGLKAVGSQGEFLSLIRGCHGKDHLLVPYLMTACIMRDYLSIRDQVVMQTLGNKCEKLAQAGGFE